MILISIVIIQLFFKVVTFEEIRNFCFKYLIFIDFFLMRLLLESTSQLCLLKDYLSFSLIILVNIFLSMACTFNFAKILLEYEGKIIQYNFTSFTRSEVKAYSFEITIEHITIDQEGHLLCIS